MKRKKTFAIINIISFLLLAFSLSFQFQDPAIELTCLLTGLIGTVISAVLSVFNPNIWNASHGPKANQYKGAFVMLVSVIFSLIILRAVLISANLIPNSLDFINLSIWIVGYAAIISPNLTYLFQRHISLNA